MQESTATAIAAPWNEAGRAFTRTINGLVRDREEGRDTPEEWPVEPRDADQARAVIALVEAEDRAGRWDPEAPAADRAHGPFAPMLDSVCQSLRHVTILGPEEFLVCPGTSHQPGTTLHLHGGEVTERPDILAVTASRSHALFAFAGADGVRVAPGLDAEPVRQFPWPEGIAPAALEDLQISEDGRHIAFVIDERAVWLGRSGDTGTEWRRVFPTDAEREAGENDDDFYDSMMHCGLSPDGRFIAYGAQSYGHFIDRIEEDGTMRRWAHIGHLSEYPHFAGFSDDGAVVALNSCHFYHGATLAVRVAEAEGLVSEPYEEDDRTPMLDEQLRVYAGTWLPGAESGFALAGAGHLNIRKLDGALHSSTYIGSTASSIDYCPRTGQLAVGVYSGFLHLFDATRRAPDDRVIGYHPILERYRWVLWTDRAPFRW